MKDNYIHYAYLGWRERRGPCNLCLIKFLKKPDNIFLQRKEVIQEQQNLLVLQEFYIADASEDQVFLGVSHNRRTAHLYISEAGGLKYSLSLERILFFSKGSGSSWLR